MPFTNGGFRRVAPAPVRYVEDPFSEPRAGSQPRHRKPVLRLFAILDALCEAGHQPIAAIGRSGIVGCVLAGDARRVLG